MTAARSILLGTILVGTLDLADAFIFFGIRNHIAPVRILHSIASGVLGKPAFQGGAGAAGLGLLLHYFIAFGIVTTFFLVSRWWRDLAARPLVYGPLYGLLVWVIMNKIVVPLSAAPIPPHQPMPQIVNGLAIHALGVGLPAAWAVSRIGAGPTA
ncbi:MAG: hypothetical protein HYR74_11920 [Candidatus Eisenbacteria bacterium]|nr:hypothetical protein [Candidatus Eisenbacteria bacterium]